MRRLPWPFNRLSLASLFRPSVPRRSARRLGVEVLEDRSVPSVTSGVVVGVTFIDNDHDGAVGPNDFRLPGVVVTLTGTTADLHSPVNISTVSDGSGNYRFDNVQRGDYQVSFDTPANFIDPANHHATAVHVAGGDTVNAPIGVGGLSPDQVSFRMFLAGTTLGDFPLPAAGPGSAPASARVNHSPTASTLPSITAHALGDTISLAGFFSDPDTTNTRVTFDTQAGPLTLELFDTLAPQTVQNFLNYVEAGKYDNMVFHRLGALDLTSSPRQVLQGGGFAFQSSPANVVSIPILGIQTGHVHGPGGVDGTGVPNEFAASRSNITGTLAMALSGNPNTANNQFFLNLVNNSTLDSQKFAVFGKAATEADMQTLQELAILGTPTDKSAFNPNFKNVPLVGYSGSSFPTDAKLNNFLAFKSAHVDRAEELTYSVVGNTNPGLVTTTIDPRASSFLNLTYAAGKTGSARITVRATDRFGTFVDASFTVTVVPPSVSVGLNTTSPGTNDTLTATVTPPANGDAVTLDYVWKVGTNIVKTNSATTALTDSLNLATSGNGDRGDTITVEVKPTANGVTGSTATASATVVNTPPSATVSITPSTPGVAENPVTAVVNSSDPDGDTVTLSYQWQHNHVDISGETNSTLNLTTVSNVQSGDTITVLVTPRDATSSGSVASATVTVT